MATGGSSLNGTNEAAPVSLSTIANSDDLKVLRDSVCSLPCQPIKDLLSHGVCARCIFRLFSLHRQISSYPSAATSYLSTILHELTDMERDEVNSSLRETNVPSNLKSLQYCKEENKVCSVCLGILHFTYADDTGMWVRKDCASDFTSAIADVVKKQGHEIDSFSLEVSLPQNIVENEQAVWSYIKEKYSSESWFSEKFPSESISTKDFLKSSMTNPLEMLLGVKSNVSSFRVRLTYTLSDVSAKSQHTKQNNGFYKRRKIVLNGIDGNADLKKVDGCHESEGHDLTINSSVKWEGGMVGFLKFPLEKVNQCCSLTFECYRTSIYIGGRYLKYSRNVSQTCWIIVGERMGEASIEEIIGGNILPMCRGDSYKFHAAGREDIDVRMLGTGRPFLVEIQNARQLPSDVIIKNIEKKINNQESKFVKVKNLKVLGSQVWDLMREGEAEKQKQYAALVWISRPLEDVDLQTLSSIKDMQILQKTPIRVLHRRSPLEREKTIHWMKIERIAGSSQYFLLHLCTQAGTYVKEFVHGDLGRTHPSIGSILKCRAEILQLDVTDVKMDWFQE